MAHPTGIRRAKATFIITFPNLTNVGFPTVEKSTSALFNCPEFRCANACSVFSKSGRFPDGVVLQSVELIFLGRTTVRGCKYTEASFETLDAHLGDFVVEWFWSWRYIRGYKTSNLISHVALFLLYPREPGSVPERVV